MSLRDYWQRELDGLRESLHKVSNGELASLKLRQKVLLFFLRRYSQSASWIEPEYYNGRRSNDIYMSEEVDVSSPNPPRGPGEIRKFLQRDSYDSPCISRFSRVKNAIEYNKWKKHRQGASLFRSYVLLTLIFIGFLFVSVFLSYVVYS